VRATLRIVVALSTASAGAASMIAAALLVSQVNNDTVQPSGVSQIAILELFVVGGVLVPLGFAGVMRNATGKLTGIVQGVSLFLGVALLAGGLGWEATTPGDAQLSLLTLYGVTAAILIGLAVLSLALSSITAVPRTSVPAGSEELPVTSGPATRAIEPPARWAFCPYCAEPTLPDQPRCWKCGRPVAVLPPARRGDPEPPVR
jgi:hypothetical protein